ncbi:MAG: calcium:proton antiporter [Alphaproteobacteria bacterium]
MKASLNALIQKEWFLGVSLLTSLVFCLKGEIFFANLHNILGLSTILIVLFAVLLGSALCVVRHADHLATRLGEPYGTLILTLSVTSIEVISISAIMLHGDNNPTLARDTLFSVVMIILNGMVGLSLFIGAWRHREQHYNLQGANAYLGVIIPLAVLGLILPNFTQTTTGPTLSFMQGTFLMFMSVCLYGTFLAIQTSRHRSYFALDEEVKTKRDHTRAKSPYSLMHHVIMLGIYMVPVVYLAEQLAPPVDYVIETLHAPSKLGGLFIALLVATPEAIGAVRAANMNNLQRSVNIFLGSVLSTISITVPAMLAISYLSGRYIVLGLQHTDIVMLLLTLVVSIVTFASGRTNVLQGMVHLILFAACILFAFEG